MESSPESGESPSPVTPRAQPQFTEPEWSGSDEELLPLLSPNSIAIAGSFRPGGTGLSVLRNLKSIGFSGPIYPINERLEAIDDLECHRSIGGLPAAPDCVVLGIPAQYVSEQLRNVQSAGVRSAVIISSGFGEQNDADGHARNDDLVQASKSIKICGPNCYGVINGYNRSAAFMGGLPDPFKPGNVALISQSGGFTNVIMNPLVEDRGIGIAYAISCGNQINVTIEDYISFLLADPNVAVIAAYVEGFRRPDRLRQLATKAEAFGKPIIVLKAGRTDAGRASAYSHTGSLAGDARVFDEICREENIVQCGSVDELIETIVLFAVSNSQHPPRRVGVVTPSGGGSALFADTALSAGLSLPQPEGEPARRIEEALPAYATISNPLDGTGVMFQRLDQLLDGLLSMPTLDAVAANVNLRRVTRDRRAFGREAGDALLRADRGSKLLIGYSTSALGLLDSGVMPELTSAGIPFLCGAENAARALVNMAEYYERRNNDLLVNSSPAQEADQAGGYEASESELSAARAAVWPGICVPAYERIEALAREFGIPVPQSRLVARSGDAGNAAGEVGYPVAVKLEHEMIAHKSDSGAVQLNCTSANEVISAADRIFQLAREQGLEEPRVLIQEMVPAGMEMIVAARRDPAWGPVVLVGFGGIYAEILDDSCVLLPPFSKRQVGEALARLRGYGLLAGARGRARYDIEGLTEIVYRVGRMSMSLGMFLDTFDINPVMVYSEGSAPLAVDLKLRLTP